VGGLLDRERFQNRRLGEPRGYLVPGDHQLGRCRHAIALRQRVVVTRLDLVGEFLTVRTYFVRLGHEHDRPAAAPEIVEHGGGSVWNVGITHQLLKGCDRGLVERADRALRRRVVRSNGFNRVADEFEPHRLTRASRVEVDHAAPNAEFAVLVNGILSRVAGGEEKVAQIDRGDLVPRRERQRHRPQPIRRTELRQQRGGGGDQQPDASTRNAVQGPGACRCNVEMRRKTAVRIDLVRRVGQNRPLDLRVRQPFQCREKEPRVAGHRLDVGIGGHDEQHAAALCRDRGKERLGGTGQPRHARHRHTKPQPAGGRLQQRSERERTGRV
jgi:hypothetical protein